MAERGGEEAPRSARPRNGMNMIASVNPGITHWAIQTRTHTPIRV